MRLSELRYKEVINEATCRKLGYICDIEFDECTGKICCVIVPEQCKGFNIFSKEGEYIIPYCSIKNIGSDIIIVNVDEKCVLKA